MGQTSASSRPYYETTVDLDLGAIHVFNLPFYAKFVEISASKDGNADEHKFDLNETDDGDPSLVLDTISPFRSNKVSIQLCDSCESRFLIKKVYVKAGDNTTTFRVIAIP